MYAYDRPCVGLMMMTMAMVVVLGCCWMPSVLAYGESSGGLPTYHERTVGSLINVARVGTPPPSSLRCVLIRSSLN